MNCDSTPLQNYQVEQGMLWSNSKVIKQGCDSKTGTLKEHVLASTSSIFKCRRQCAVLRWICHSTMTHWVIAKPNATINQVLSSIRDIDAAWCRHFWHASRESTPSFRPGFRDPQRPSRLEMGQTVYCSWPPLAGQLWKHCQESKFEPHVLAQLRWSGGKKHQETILLLL